MNGRTLMRHKSMFRVSLLTLATSLATISTSTWSDTHSDEQSDFKKRLYLGIGLGASTLQPKPREPAILSVGDDSDIGFHLNLGYDINRWLSAELYLANLGEADIDRIDAGNEQVAWDSIDYLIADVSILGYLFNSRSGLTRADTQNGVFCREALSLYGRLGLGVMRNEDKNSLVNHDRNYKGHLSFGVGLEYGFHNGLGIRAEWMSFDTDARYANISLVKRFGDSACQQKKIQYPPTPTPTTTTPTPTTTFIPAFKAPIPIAAPTILFDFDISTPDELNSTLLSQFAKEIKDIPGTLQLIGHTDSFGTNDYNDQLSKDRVEAVFQQLIDNGIDKTRIISADFRGENIPVSSNSNDTESGRALNRRVEIVFKPDT